MFIVSYRGSFCFEIFVTDSVSSMKLGKLCTKANLDIPKIDKY